MKIKVLKENEKEEILNRLAYFGKLKTDSLFIKTGEKIRAFTGNLRSNEIEKIWNNFMIESIGLYIIKDAIDKNKKFAETRLSLEGVFFFKDLIKNNIIEVNDAQKELWLKGEGFELEDEQIKKHKHLGNFIILKFKEDLLGCSKIKNEKNVLNYMPKERRIKNE